MGDRNGLNENSGAGHRSGWAMVHHENTHDCVQLTRCEELAHQNILNICRTLVNLRRYLHRALPSSGLPQERILEGHTEKRQQWRSPRVGVPREIAVA